MSDEPEPNGLLETIVEGIRDCLPERLREDEDFAYLLGSICGFVTGYVVTHKVITLLFPKGDDK